LRVLVAEDNAVNQLVVGKILQRLGCEVTIVETGLAVLDTWASHAFDVVLMDCHMPGMDGFEATRRIRSESREGGEVPIIALTASALPADREQALLAGMSDFLTKPIFTRALETALRRSRSRTKPGSNKSIRVRKAVRAARGGRQNPRKQLTRTKILERETRLELATSTLARLRSTN
jgi:CheY-like chemotaxis protein